MQSVKWKQARIHKWSNILDLTAELIGYQTDWFNLEDRYTDWLDDNMSRLSASIRQSCQWHRTYGDKEDHYISLDASRMNSGTLFQK